MTPPCRNCHNAPSTQPDSPENQVLNFQETGKKSADSLSPYPLAPPCHKTCSAEVYWPEHLDPSIPKMQSLPWWVRNNFEKTRIEKAIDLEEPHLPFRIHIEKGSIAVNLQPKKGEFELPKDLEIRTNDSASVSAKINIRDNKIPLWEQSLLTFQGIEIHSDYYPGALGTFEEVKIGNFGGIHLFLKGDPLLHFLLMPPKAPTLPVGEDFPTESQVREMGKDENSLPAWVYPNLKEDPLDLDLDGVLWTISKTARKKIADHFYDRHGRLPKSYNFEKLGMDILRYMSGPSGPKKPLPPGLDKLLSLSNLKPGQIFELDFEIIKDFFLPGVLDLAPSGLLGQVEYTQDQKFEIRFSEISFNLDPMDYPINEKNRRGPLKLKKGWITSATLAENESAKLAPPGIRLIYDPKEKTIDLQTHLGFALFFDGPPEEGSKVSGRFLARSQFSLKSGKLALTPGVTEIKISDLNIAPLKEGKAWASDLNISISDEPQALNPVLWALANQGKPLTYVNVDGKLRDSEVSLEGVTLIPTNDNGEYDFSDFVKSLAFQIMGELQTKEGKTYQAGLIYNKEIIENEDTTTKHQVTFNIDFIPSTDGSSLALVKDGFLNIDTTHKDSKLTNFDFMLGAKRLHHGPVHLDQPLIQINLETEKENGVSEYRVPLFLIQANPEGNRKGLFKGILEVEQQNMQDKPLRMIWDREKNQFRVENLNTKINLQNIDFRSMIPKKMARALDPSIAGIGMDGNLFGNFTVNLPKDYPDNKSKISGSGNIRLRGDQQGDIYFVDKFARQTGPALFRDTIWKWNQIYGINTERGYALGDFNLDTIINIRSLFRFSGLPPSPPPEGPVVYGLRGQELNPFEINAQMGYDNQPWWIFVSRTKPVPTKFTPTGRSVPS